MPANNNIVLDEGSKISDTDPLNALLAEARYTNFLLETLLRGRTAGAYLKNADFRYSLTQRDVTNIPRTQIIGSLPPLPTTTRQ